MGGANSIVNVFDVNNYHKEQLAAMKKMQTSRERADSYEQLNAEEDKNEGQTSQRGKFGADMIVPNKGAAAE